MPPSTQVSLWQAGVGGEWVCRCEEKRGQQAPPRKGACACRIFLQPRYFAATEAQRTPLGAKAKDEALCP